jgi:hypothetical protein
MLPLPVLVDGVRGRRGGGACRARHLLDAGLAAVVWVGVAVSLAAALAASAAALLGGVSWP